MEDQSSLQHQLIDDYLLGNLSGNDLDAFEKRMKEDKEFAAEVYLHRMIVKGIRDQEEIGVRDIMNKADNEMDPPVIRWFSRYMYYSYAAVVLAFIALGIYLLFFFQPQSKELFTEYFVPYDNDFIAMARGQEIPEALAHFNDEEYGQILTAMNFYDKEEYSKTIKILENISLDNNKDPELIFYLAISQLENGQTSEAIENLKLLSGSSDHPYQDEATWYLALAYLNAGDKQRSKQLLNKISRSNTPFAQQAKELLRELQ